MSTRNNLHRLALASAVAAMLAAAAPGAFAQGNTPPPADTTTPGATSPTTPGATNPTTTDAPGTTVPTPGNTPDASTPGSGSTGSGTSGSSASGSGSTGSSASMPMSPGTSGGSSMAMDPSTLPTDYSVLNNRVFDATNLQQARARGLSDTEIATIVKISKETGFDFDTVAGMVERGQSFPSIATEYNLKLSDVYEVDKEKQQISDYDALSKYANSLGKNSSMMAMPISSPSPQPAPMAPMTPSTPAPAPSTTSTNSSATPTLDIVDTAMAAKNLTTLVHALQIAGLVETLKGAGPFTVFAPDNKAFAKLPAGALDALEADPAKLRQVLTYHVIPANIMASDAMAMTSPTSPPTVEGATLNVTKGRKGRLLVNGATVTKADIQATNGTNHIINHELMPPTDSTTSATPPTDTTTTPAAPAPAPMDATPPTPPATPDPNAAPAPAPATPDPNAPAPGATPAPGTAPATGAGNTPTQ